MAQLTRSGMSTAPTGVITVADLLSRYAPDPMVAPEPATEPVTVESLLRREGRGHSAPRVPATVRAEAAEESHRPTGLLVRRGAVAAGVLVAAGSVLGAVVVNTTASTEYEPPRAAGGDHPGAGRLDPQPAPDGAIPVVVDTAAQADPLDPGDAAPTSWMRTAFPGGGTAADTATPQAATPQAAPLVPADRAPADRGAAPTAPAQQPGPSAERPTGGSGGADQGTSDGQPRVQQTPGGTDDDADRGGSPTTPAPPTGPADPDADDGTTAPEPAAPERSGGVVGGVVEDVGGALPEPVGTPVETLGQTVGRLI